MRNRSESSLKPYVCPVCKQQTLVKSEKTLVCEKCNYKGNILPQGVADLLYLDEIGLYRDKIIDYNYIPDDMTRWYKKHGSTQVFVELLIEELRNIKMTRKELRILDVGSFLYTDMVFKPFAEELRPEVDEYWAIDPSPHTFKSLSPLSSFYLARAFGEFLPVPDQRVNCIISISTLDHLFDIEKFFKEAFRILKDEGSLIVMLNNDGSWFKRLFRSKADKAREKAKKTEHNYLWNPQDFHNLLIKNEFDIQKFGGFRYLPILGNSRIARRLLRYHTHVALADFVDRNLTRIIPHLGGNFWVHAVKRGTKFKCG